MIQKKKLHIFSLSNGTLTETKTEEVEDVSAVEYSPDGAYLAFSSRNKAKMYNVSDWKVGVHTIFLLSSFFFLYFKNIIN